MSTAFGWTVEEVEQQVVALIQSGAIQARVDSQNKVRFLSLSVTIGPQTDAACACSCTLFDWFVVLPNSDVLWLHRQQVDLLIKPPKGSAHHNALTEFLQSGGDCFFSLCIQIVPHIHIHLNTRIRATNVFACRKALSCYAQPAAIYTQVIRKETLLYRCDVDSYVTLLFFFSVVEQNQVQ